MEEKDLSEYCKREDDRARKKLYESYAGRLLSISLRYVGDREQAEDLVHDAFIKIFASFHQFEWRGNGSLRAWLERIMVNMSLEYLRKKSQTMSFESLDELPEEMEPPQDEEVSLIPSDVLMRFISELPDGYRMVFNLFTFEEKSHKEIASMLNINEKSSSSQYFRAKTSLAKRINEYLKANH